MNARTGVKALLAVLAVAALTSCASDGPASPPAPPSVDSYVEGNVTIHKAKVEGLDRKGTYDVVAPDVITWCEGTTLYATTPVYQIDRGGAGGSVAIALNGCKDGVPK